MLFALIKHLSAIVLDSFHFGIVGTALVAFKTELEEAADEPQVVAI